MASAIEFNRGIERILPYRDPQQAVQLPEKTYLAPEGERVTNHLETYFNTHRALPPLDQFIDFLRPTLNQINVTAPWYFTKCLMSVLEEWKKKKDVISSEAKQQSLDKGLSILNVMESDVELLNHYVLCLQKV